MLGPLMFAEIVMYRTRFCSYCMRAARLLADKGVPFREIDVSDDPDTRERLLTETGSHTVPQIFINGTSVGGYDDIERLDRRGALDPLLRQAPVP
ncbi:MAG TPA: glutaredoxin 3 [Polyangiaceae bacterium]|jgi:glutaredoxin 3|nr:glutaredoxin 3 [Polyangiaceae bacterium]